jgi:hypothetical protein
MEKQTTLFRTHDFLWNGIPAYLFEGSVEEISPRIPVFDRAPFVLGLGNPACRTVANPHRDAIVHRPSDPDMPPVPIAVVSKTYALLQHSHVLRLACEAIEGIGAKPSEAHASLEITEYGERMKLGLRLPNKYRFDPGDGHPLDLELICFNSVDESMGFRALLGWFRLVCSNGMVVGTALTNFQRIHNKNLHIEEIGTILQQGMELARNDRKQYERWRKTPVPEEKLRRWIDGPVREQWGVKAATRAYHIAITGHDVRFANPFERAIPSEREVERARAVRGAAVPADNKFAVSQVLSWLASRRTNPTERVEWMETIPKLMARLNNRN